MRIAGFRSLLVLFAVFVLASPLMAAEYTLQPGPGLNDGSDNGGPASGKDTLVYEGDPGMNYGANTGLAALPYSYCNSTHERLFIQFDLSSLPANAAHAYVGFYHGAQTSYCLGNCDNDYYIFPLSSSWSEMSVTWNTQPSHDAWLFGPFNFTFPDAGGLHEYEITSLYNDWKSGSRDNYGMMVDAIETDGCNNAAVGFFVYSSDETGNPALRPYLRVVTAEAVQLPPDVPALDGRALLLLVAILAAAGALLVRG